MWTVSAFQQHPRTLMICDEDATLDLKVRTVKYFKDLWDVHSKLNHDSIPIEKKPSERLEDTNTLVTLTSFQ